MRELGKARLLIERNNILETRRIPRENQSGKAAASKLSLI